LIDNRFDNVNDWKRLENDSNIPKINKNNSNVDKNIINNTPKITKPNIFIYIIEEIKTAINPKKYTSIKLPTNNDIDKNTFNPIRIDTMELINMNIR